MLTKNQVNFFEGGSINKGEMAHVTISNKNRSYKNNEQISKQNINNSECFGVKFVKIYPEMTSQ
jgi:hypothetical protein